MIIITGPGRSGTSVLAKFCLKMGYNPGGSWYDCVDAGLEHPRVAAINDAMYQEATRTGKVEQSLEQYREEMRSLDLAVVKDPRFTFHPAILRAWHSVRTDLKVLMTYRTPEHSLASRRCHNRDLIDKNKKHPDVLRCDFANVIEVMLDQEIPFTMLLFPNFLTQYQNVYQAFKALGMSFDPEEGRAAWSTMINMEKVHFRPEAAMQIRTAPPAKAVRDLPWQRIAQMSLRTSRNTPALLMSLLIVLVCAPFEWKALSAAAAPENSGLQGTRVGPYRAHGAPTAFAAHPFRRRSEGVRFDAAFMAGLSLYSVQRFPFDTLRPGHAFRHRGIKQAGHRAG